ncbi:MAG: pilus assembly protein PilP [Proteobacteria bacterium]|nr:pilus assembly protein PilP [Pseudomonadota bacterium]
MSYIEKRMKRRSPHFIALALSSLLLAGCAGDMSDLERFVSEEKAKKAGPIEPLPQIQPYETFSYEAHDLRSPFVPDTEANQASEGQLGSGTGLRPDITRNKEYLEQFPLDGLKMVGTIESQGETYALVSDPDGSVHRIQPGNYLGQNHGKVTQVTGTQIRVTEIVPDGLGGWMERQAAIGLDE